MNTHNLFRVMRDPSSEGGGNAPAPEAPAAPQVVTPTSYGGSNAFRDWQDPYDDPKFQAQATPQPPSNGNKTPIAPAAVGEGGIVGQPAEAGSLNPNASSTASGEPGQAPAEASKGALSAEDRTYWETKDPAFKDMPDHPAVAKMSGQYRELESKYTQGQQYLSVVNQTVEDYKAVLATGDPAEIAKMVEHFGGEVQFDTRKSADVVKEIQGSYQDLVAAFKAFEGEMTPEQAQAINRGLTAYAGQLNGKIGVIEAAQARKEEIRKEVARVTGVQTPQIGNPNERYKAPAKANMTALEREMNDPNFWQYYDEIKGAFGPGGMFHAQGITAGKAFGASIDSARYYMALAKGQWLSKNMQTKVLPAHEQAWLKKQQGNGAVASVPRGAGAVTAPGIQDPGEAAYARKLEEHMNRRSGSR